MNRHNGLVVNGVRVLKGECSCDTRVRGGDYVIDSRPVRGGWVRRRRVCRKCRKRYTTHEFRGSLQERFREMEALRKHLSRFVQEQLT